MSTGKVVSSQIYKFQADNHDINEGFVPFRAEIWDREGWIHYDI